MKTIEQLSQKTKDRVIEIPADGVTFELVQICVKGISCDNLGIDSLEETVLRFEECVANSEKYNHGYAAQALTIFGRFASQPMVDKLEEKYGVRLTPEQIEEKIQQVVAAYLPKVTI